MSFKFNLVGKGNFDLDESYGNVVLKKNWKGTVKINVTVNTINGYFKTTNIFYVKLICGVASPDSLSTFI